MRRTRRVVATAAALLALGSAAALAHVRLVTSGKTPLWWSSPGNVSIVINSTGSEDITDGSHFSAIRLAIEEWNSVPGTTATLVEDTSPSSQARTDWNSTSSRIHLVLFDEDDSSGYFGGSSGTVAVTPVSYSTSTGQIVDADILFNGDDHQFTTSGEPGRFDVQDVVTHELGHFLGLDHSGWAGASMYPYVDPTVILHRSVSNDEVHGMREAYPQVSFGRITGHVERASGGAPIVGAHVVTRDSFGRAVAGTLTDASGDFTLFGLDPETYTVYVTPLDGPVSAGNLGDGIGSSVETDFEPAYYPATATITAVETVDVGTLALGPDVALNLGESSDLFPVRVTTGSSTGVFLSGTGLSAGSTLTASDPDLTVSGVVWLGGAVNFQVSVPLGEAPGHVDLEVVNGMGERSILPAALEITPPSPSVGTVTPDMGGASGGTALTITGSGFHPGASVVIGDQAYRDGVDATVVDGATITLTTKATQSGTLDVVVIDGTGVEGRLMGGFRTVAIPVLNQRFPVSGDVAGGTSVTLTGQDFLPDPIVRIGGVDQTVTSASATKIVFDTEPGGMPGVAQDIEVENTDGGTTTLTGGFTYVGQPDPLLTAVAPGSGSTAGGETVTLSGANFTAGCQVFFGVDPDTGTGGTPATNVTLVDPGTITADTPSHAAGTVAVLVLDGTSMQAALAASAFSFSSPPGGGGCATVPVVPPRGPRSMLLGAWWMVLVTALLASRARRARPLPVRGE